MTCLGSQQQGMVSQLTSTSTIRSRPLSFVHVGITGASKFPAYYLPGPRLGPLLLRSPRAIVGQSDGRRVRTGQVSFGCHREVEAEPES